MQFEKVYPQSFQEKVKLKGMVITPKFVSSELKGIQISDGDSAIDVTAEYGSLVLCVPKKPTVKRWVVTANFGMFGEVKRVFDTEADADQVSGDLKTLGVGSLVDEIQVEVSGGEKEKPV